ncbi:MAG: Bug family tripartite tricarboxylate transporter substrate binding protein [Burkholderiales bacterium]
MHISRLKKLLVLCIVAAPVAASAQLFPSKPIRIVSIFGVGSVAESSMRLLGQKLTQSLNQPVVVETQAGAGGVIGGQRVARSAPDGYTLLFTELVQQLVAPMLLKEKPFDPLKDLEPITNALEGGICLIAGTATPFNSMKEFIDYAKRNPGKLSYGSGGVGALNHLQMELLNSQLGLDITHVPYKGGTASMTDVIANQIPLGFVAIGAAMPNLRSGKLKILGIVDNKRHALAPELAVIGEEVPGFEKIPTGLMLYAPAGMPRPILTRLHGEVVAQLNSAEYRAEVRKFFFVPVGNSLAEAAQQQKDAMTLIAKAVKSSGIKPE